MNKEFEANKTVFLEEGVTDSLDNMMNRVFNASPEAYARFKEQLAEIPMVEGYEYDLDTDWTGTAAEGLF